MLCIDMGVVGKWAERHKLSYTTYTDLSAKAEECDPVLPANPPPVRELVTIPSERTNSQLSEKWPREGCVIGTIVQLHRQRLEGPGVARPNVAARVRNPRVLAVESADQKS